MNVGDLVRAASHPRARAYPKSLGIVTSDLGSLTAGPEDIVYVLWSESGKEQPVKIMFLELVSEIS